MENQNTTSPEKRVYDFCRYFVAFVIITYGWAKITGSQFTVLDSELDKPLGEVSGFWLTWHYFGFSPFYGNFIALVQIVAGFLLIWRKTVLPAACVLFGVVGNIILIDIFYAVDLGALMMAGVLAGGLFIILSFHRRELIDLFWTRQNSVFPDVKNTPLFRALRVFAIVWLILIPPSCAYYVAHYTNRFPTELDGKWQVVETTAPITDGDQPLTKIYFEYNRAFMTVFRFGDGKWTTHHFELNPQTKQIDVWEKWLTKGDEIFSGQYELAGDKLVLRGQYRPSRQPVVIELQKRP